MNDMATILTLGYEKRSIEEYIDVLTSADVRVLFDVRETAWSHKPGFSKARLRAELERVGIRYLHLPAVGNPKVLRSRAKTHAECLASYRIHLDQNPACEDSFDAAVREALLRGERICLMCFERHPDDCHRGIIAERWVRRHGGRVEHLGPDGCPRLL